MLTRSLAAGAALVLMFSGSAIAGTAGIVIPGGSATYDDGPQFIRVCDLAPDGMNAKGYLIRQSDGAILLSQQTTHGVGTCRNKTNETMPAGTPVWVRICVPGASRSSTDCARYPAVS